MKPLSIVLLLMFAFTTAQSQQPDLKAVFIADWERAKAYTKEYLDAMPEGEINFRASTETRSFAEQMLHLSQGSIGLSSNATGRERIYAGVNLEKVEEYKGSREALAKVVMDSYDFVIEGIKAMDDSKWNEVVKRGNFEITRLGWLMKAFEHQTHHRGQCTIYLRLKGIAPPNEKLF